MSREKRLWVVLVLNLLLTAGCVIVGVRAHSLGVLAAGVDYLGDTAVVGVSLFAVWLAHRPDNARGTGGFPNATTIAALVNGGWLLVLSALVIVAAVERLISGAPSVQALPVLIVSAVAAAVMVIGALVLRGGLTDADDGEDLNVKAVLLDTTADAAAAGGVAVSGGVILAADGLYWLDPAVALIIAAVVGYHALKLLWKVVTKLRSSSSGSAAARGSGGPP